MPNFAQAVKAEIVRLSRKEIKAQVGPLKNPIFILKRTVSDLKRKVAILESETKRLSAMVKDSKSHVSAEEASKARITSRNFKALRKKLGLSQDSFAKLLGISGQAVYANEHKTGRLRLRSPTVSAFLSLRNIGKREAKRMLNEMK